MNTKHNERIFGILFTMQPFKFALKAGGPVVGLPAFSQVLSGGPTSLSEIYNENSSQFLICLYENISRA